MSSLPMIAQQGKWDVLDGQFVVSLRVGAATREAGLDSLIGRSVTAKAKSGKMEQVFITGVARDYGLGDVTLFSVSRVAP